VRKSAASVPSNIAEGAARTSTRELVQFLGYASGSRAETDSHLEIASQLGFVRSDSEVIKQLERVGQLLTALRKSLKKPFGRRAGLVESQITNHASPGDERRRRGGLAARQ
jgi:hypothetical protein